MKVMTRDTDPISDSFFFKKKGTSVKKHSIPAHILEKAMPRSAEKNGVGRTPL
jgi:hypothetical protein